MIAATDQEGRAYLQLLATVANLLKQDTVYRQLCAASSSAEVLDAIDLAD
jgi:mannitol/fructose-specific phosphotransferase system IIA component (Ntr-type)